MLKAAQLIFSVCVGISARRQNRVTAMPSEFFADPYEKAKELGLQVVLPGDNELQLDIDNLEDLDFVDAQLKIMKGKEEFVITKRTKSKSGNDHVYIALDRALSPIERIALQACLGSDRKRELLSLMALFTGCEYPATLLFEKPETKLLAAPVQPLLLEEADNIACCPDLTDEQMIDFNKSITEWLDDIKVA